MVIPDMVRVAIARRVGPRASAALDNLGCKDRQHAERIEIRAQKIIEIPLLLSGTKHDHPSQKDGIADGFNRMAAWLMPMLEQLLRFFDFGKILPRIEIEEDRHEHLGYRRRSAIGDVKARESQCAAQLESLGLLASRDFQGSSEGIFGGGNVRRVATQQKLTTDTMQFGIQ